MVGDMFNHGLKAKVDGLCSELSQRDTTSLASGGRLSPLDFAGDMLQRAPDLLDRLGGDPRIERRGVELGVPQQS